MGVGTYNLPICDGCKLPWLPVGWTQDSDPRNLREGAKPLRCGKCKSIGWDREFVKQQKLENGNVAQTDRAHAASDAPEVMPLVATQVGEVAGSTPAVSTTTQERVTAILVCKRCGGDTFDGDMQCVVCEPVAALVTGSASALRKTRCKHRMTDCPICHPKEAA